MYRNPSSGKLMPMMFGGTRKNNFTDNSNLEKFEFLDLDTGVWSTLDEDRFSTWSMPKVMWLFQGVHLPNGNILFWDNSDRVIRIFNHGKWGATPVIPPEIEMQGFSLTERSVVC